MTVRVALLRGVNVAGKGRLPMAEFRAVLAGLGLGRVETCIQSGNAVFDSDQDDSRVERLISEAIADRFGFAPEVFVLGAADIAAAVTDHPFAAADPSRLHVFFLKEDPAPDEEALRVLAEPGDGWHRASLRFTLHTPGGIGRSKLARALPRLLPAPMTARNLRTLVALSAMVAARA